jgi:hypothetical protein
MPLYRPFFIAEMFRLSSQQPEAKEDGHGYHLL